MKAVAFDYIRPASLDEVCRLLAAASDEEFNYVKAGQLVAGTFIDDLPLSLQEAPLGVSLHELPLRMSDIEAAINESQGNDEAITP